MTAPREEAEGALSRIKNLDGKSVRIRTRYAIANALLDLADAVRELQAIAKPRPDLALRPRHDDDLIGRCPATRWVNIPDRTLLSCSLRADHSGLHRTPEGGSWTELPTVPDATFDHPITVGGIPAEHRQTVEALAKEITRLHWDLIPAAAPPGLIAAAGRASARAALAALVPVAEPKHEHQWVEVTTFEDNDQRSFVCGVPGCPTPDRTEKSAGKT